jgi:ankyrin repeat protein
MASSKARLIRRSVLLLCTGLAGGGCAFDPVRPPYEPTAATATVVQAIETGRCEELARMLAAGAEPNPPQSRVAPLALAVARREPSCAQALLRAGADPDQGLADGTSPLLLAAGDGRDDLVDLLIAAGASPMRVNSAGMAPLAAAAGNGHARTVARLLAAAAPVDLQSARGWTALFHAVAERRVAALDVLLSAGADVDHRDVNGTTALMIAAAACGECVAPLLARNADVDASDTRGVTALMVAAQNGQEATMQALLAAGADASRRDHRGRGWRDWAVTVAR